MRPSPRLTNFPHALRLYGVIDSTRRVLRLFGDALGPHGASGFLSFQRQALAVTTSAQSRFSLPLRRCARPYGLSVFPATALLYCPLPKLFSRHHCRYAFPWAVRVLLFPHPHLLSLLVLARGFSISKATRLATMVEWFFLHPTFGGCLRPSDLFSASSGDTLSPLGQPVVSCGCPLALYSVWTISATLAMSFPWAGRFTFLRPPCLASSASAALRFSATMAIRLVPLGRVVLLRFYRLASPPLPKSVL